MRDSICKKQQASTLATYVDDQISATINGQHLQGIFLMILILAKILLLQICSTELNSSILIRIFMAKLHNSRLIVIYVTLVVYATFSQ